jgi:hypothetical protein
VIILIDANVVVGFYKETVLGIDNELTGPVAPLFQRLGEEDTCFLDDGKMIESEWRLYVEKEWFTSWYAGLLAAGKIEEIPAEKCPGLEKQMYVQGFPKQSRDIWYVRVGNALLCSGRILVHLISEDLDFYDPTKKKSCRGPARTKFLKRGSGPIEKLLRKHAIRVRAVCNYP